MWDIYVIHPVFSNDPICFIMAFLVRFKADRLAPEPTGAVHGLTRGIPDLSSWLQAGELSGRLSHPVIPPQLYSQDQVRFSLQSGPLSPTMGARVPYKSFMLM